MIKYFVKRNFRGTCSSVEMLKGYMLLCRNAEGVHDKRKVGNPCSGTTAYTEVARLMTFQTLAFLWIACNFRKHLPPQITKQSILKPALQHRFAVKVNDQSLTLHGVSSNYHLPPTVA